MKNILEDDENLIMEGAANCQRGIESVGGKLLLTNKRLYFIPHSLNIQSQLDAIYVKNIRSIAKVHNKLLDIFPIFPNALLINTSDGKEYRFTVFKRNQWEEKINKIRIEIQ